jgi:hypothetical protein
MIHSVLHSQAEAISILLQQLDINVGNGQPGQPSPADAAGPAVQLSLSNVQNEA